VVVELYFYLYANGPDERRSKALTELRRSLEGGYRSPGWDFSGNLERAREDGHPEVDWLERLAAVIADEAPLKTLDDWVAWQAAG
jgi:hypothetical protein